MDKRKEYFYKDLIIEDEDKDRAARYLNSKGVEKHIIIKDKLSNWIDGGKIEYSMIASMYRYDKRLRLILFKYISYLEERYRAVILDEYRSTPRRIKWIKDLTEKIKDCNWDLNDALEKIDFTTLLIQSNRLPPRVRGRCGFPGGKHFRENSIAIRELRNAVMHNKFLLLFRGFETCYIDGVDGGKGTSLKANILNLLAFLPSEVAEKCKKEINEAKNEKERHKGTKWNLPSFVEIQV